MCYESIGIPYDSAHTNKELFTALQPMSEYVWKKRFSDESGRMAGGVLLYEWLQVLQQSVEQWSKCEHKPDDHACQGAALFSSLLHPESLMDFFFVYYSAFAVRYLSLEQTRAVRYVRSLVPGTSSQSYLSTCSSSSAVVQVNFTAKVIH